MENITPIYGSTNPEIKRGELQRFASVIGLEPKLEQVYRALHADVWPSVLNRLANSHIQNYSIYIAEIDDKKYLFSYLEYFGNNFAKDMQAIADDLETQRWWQETDPCQWVLSGVADNERWKPAEQVFWMR